MRCEWRTIQIQRSTTSGVAPASVQNRELGVQLPVANIERVSMLFLTKTAYATGLAVLFGVMLLPCPFLPRQLSVVDGLTIGIPAFFLALMPNHRRYVPGFLRRSLRFAIPAGSVIALVLALYSRMATDAGIPEQAIRTERFGPTG